MQKYEQGVPVINNNNIILVSIIFSCLLECNLTIAV